MSVIMKRNFPVFTFLALIFLLLIASLNLYLLKGVVTVPGLPDNIVERYDEVPSWQRQLTHLAGLSPIAGHQKKGTKFLAIGIATVYREEHYILKTLQSLVDNSSPEEQDDVVVILYLADTDASRKQKQLDLILQHFQAHLDSGFFQVIESRPEIYPPMDFALTKRTYDDPADRVIWRAKQSIDFAFLFTYAKSLSTYYLIMEDDVISSSEYITAIKEYVEFKGNHHWVVLRFAEFEGIGVLLRNSDLPQLTQFIVLFHQEQPWDYILGQFILIQVPEKILVKRTPSIFQHIGLNSTLPKKVQPIVDKSFDTMKRRFQNHNPPADIVTTMLTYMEYLPQYAYRSTPGMFWGIVQPNQTFDIIFKQPQSISRVVVLSGVPNTVGNITTFTYGLQEANIQVSPKFINKTAVCESFTSISEFQQGEVDIVGSSCNLLSLVQCLRIQISPNTAGFIVIREIEVFS